MIIDFGNSVVLEGQEEIEIFHIPPTPHPPEFKKHGVITFKTDVFYYGDLIEIMSDYLVALMPARIVPVFNSPHSFPGIINREHHRA